MENGYPESSRRVLTKSGLRPILTKEFHLSLKVCVALSRYAVLAGSMLLVLEGVPGRAQSQSIPFDLRVQQGNNVFLVPNNVTLAMPSGGVGQTVSIIVTGIYRGVTSVLLASQPALLGNTDFSVEPDDVYPLRLSPGGYFSFKVTYKPTTAALASGQINLGYVEAAPPGTSGTTSVAGLITVNLQGTAPNLSVAYFLASNANAIPLPAGGTLLFQPTVVNTTAQATVIVTNRGSATGQINSISVSGTAFQAFALPLTPASVLSPSAGASDVRFLINYTPTQAGNDTGTLQMDLGGVSFTATLSGSGIQAKLTYKMLTATDTVTFTPNQTLTLPDTNIGETARVTVSVQNTGSAPGVISAVGTTAGPFAITDSPVLPATLNPQDVITFTLSFLPVTAGKATGKLRIGNDLFDLTGNGLGPNLVYSYVSGSTTSVQPGGVVVFSPVQVGSSARLPFTVMNSGTKPATIATIAVGETHGVFQLLDLPPLPATLDPNDSVTFNIMYTPSTTGFASAVLQLNNQQFLLSGSGTPPPALPDYRYTGASGDVDPQSQPAVGLTLTDTYPLALTGTLTIAVTSAAFTPDPAIQFSNGSRIASFTIPANSTQAVFANNANQIRLQTGSTAGTLTITPTFATPAGLDLTPAPPKALTLTVQPSAPRIVSVVEKTSAANGFTLAISGYSTTRSLTKVNFQFTVTSDVTSPTTQFSMDISQAATNWYSSSQAQPFGGQFAVSVPFTLTSSGLSQSSSSSTTSGSSTSTTTTTPTLISKIQSVTVSVANEQGTSNSLSTPIQ
ncbi:MAG: hypothetical protein C5B51_20890 [Terriglobia bacterium]|nr:MAG: hypothetical protein C5B51_20890 [Terriglobia bacterium]